MDLDKSRFCEMYIVRHGQTEGNRAGIVTGHLETPLNETGREQVVRTKHRIGDLSFDEVFASDSGRACETAQIISGPDVIINSRKDLRERCFGSYEGVTLDAYAAVLQSIQSLPDEEKFRVHIGEGSESHEDASLRMMFALREIASEYIGKRVLVGSHGGVMRSLLVILGLGSYSELHPGVMYNAAHIKLYCDGVSFFVEEVCGYLEESKYFIKDFKKV